MAGTTTLYPPIVQTYAPAFVIEEGTCRVPFSLSSFNKREEITEAQVMVSYQNNNLTALDRTKYPAGIKIVNLSTDSSGGYYIELSTDDIKFTIDQYYKVQIRFSAVSYGADNPTSSWINDNINHFSEWSTVCLVRAINRPAITIKGFNSDVITTTLNYVIANIDFKSDIEYLKSYQIKLINKENGNTELDSGILYSNINNNNEINYEIHKTLIDGIRYKLIISCVSSSGYEFSEEKDFVIVGAGGPDSSCQISAFPRVDLGRIELTFAQIGKSEYAKNFIIRRASSKSNFEYWEDIYSRPITSQFPVEFTWYDYTVESGIWYKYCALCDDGVGNRGVVTFMIDPIMLILDDMFLKDKNIQLNIKYNPNISSFKKTIVESKIDTIGSKYPFFRRNGQVGYRTFPISGLITSYCDENGDFISRDTLYGEAKNLYETYNYGELQSAFGDASGSFRSQQAHNDYVFERFFREKVMDFLQDNTIKLFRSTTEGNILVKLMDVSFTPNQQLGRLIYTFNATAYEADECNLENLKKYEIQDFKIDDVEKQATFLQNGVAAIKLSIKSNTDIDIIQAIKDRINAQVSDTKYDYQFTTLKSIKLDLRDIQPYIIANNQLYTKADANNKDLMSGYLVTINGKTIAVSAQTGVYQIDNAALEISNLSVFAPAGTIVNIEIPYNAYVTKTLKEAEIPKGYSYDYKVGQYYNIIEPYCSFRNILADKYYLARENYYTDNLVAINKVRIESEPGTVVYLKVDFEEEYQRYVIGKTGVLTFENDAEDTTINDLFICGRLLNQRNRPVTEDDLLREGEYYYETGVTEIPESPVEGYVYQLETAPAEVQTYINELKANAFSIDNEEVINGSINSGRYIYYRGHWRPFTGNSDIDVSPDEFIPLAGCVILPMQVCIDYAYEKTRGDYTE